MKVASKDVVIRDLKEEVEELAAMGSRVRDERDALQRDIAEGRKANEGLDAERNFLKARIFCLETAIKSLSRIVTEQGAALSAATDWRTKPTVKS